MIDEIINTKVKSATAIMLRGDFNSMCGSYGFYARIIINTEPFEYDFTNEPDLAQTLTVTCCLKDIPFTFSGLQSLKIKETNRVAALITELGKLGYILHEPAEGQLAWNGERCEAADNPVIATYDDHRMAMAFAPAALLQPISIEHPEVVSKSYPNFWNDLKKITVVR